MADILLDDIFEVSQLDPDGKKFDRVSRIKCATSETYHLSLLLDINVELFPVRLKERISVALTRSISMDGNDEGSAGGYRADSGPSLADKYDYVMYGRVFKFEDTSNAQRM